MRGNIGDDVFGELDVVYAGIVVWSGRPYACPVLRGVRCPLRVGGYDGQRGDAEGGERELG